MGKIIMMFSIFYSLSLSANTSIFEHKVQKPETTYNKELCKLFTEKATTYEVSMRDDAYAQATLQSYKDRALIYCKE
ncbi:MAG: hypothetical protein PF439_04970 [Helicobacteraceae bacterium]|jgi:hypothetical protein|nr:hypothetical protein [Helicobacteraceae bacterium]